MNSSARRWRNVSSASAKSDTRRITSGVGAGTAGSYCDQVTLVRPIPPNPPSPRLAAASRARSPRLLRLGQRERLSCDPVGEQPLARPEDDREDHQPQLVDETLVDERADEG